MSSTTSTLSASTSRNPLLAAIGIGGSILATATGTFWDLTGNESGSNDSVGAYLAVVGITVVAAAAVFGLVVRTAGAANPDRRAAVLGVVGFLSCAVFWTGLPLVLAAGSVACALTDHDKVGGLGAGSKAGLALSALTAAAAVLLAITG